MSLCGKQKFLSINIFLHCHTISFQCTSIVVALSSTLLTLSASLRPRLHTRPYPSHQQTTPPLMQLKKNIRKRCCHHYPRPLLRRLLLRPTINRCRRRRLWGGCEAASRHPRRQAGGTSALIASETCLILHLS